MAPFCAPCTTSAAAARCAALQFGVGGLVQSSSCCGGSNVADFRVREGRDGKPRDAMLCSRSAGIYELGGFGRLSLRDGDEFVRTLAAAGTGGVWFRKKRRWKAANSSSANVICEVSGGIGTETEVFESRVLNVSVSVSSSSSSSPSGSADAASSNQVVASESIFLSSTEKR